MADNRLDCLMFILFDELNTSSGSNVHRKITLEMFDMFDILMYMNAIEQLLSMTQLWQKKEAAVASL